MMPPNWPASDTALEAQTTSTKELSSTCSRKGKRALLWNRVNTLFPGVREERGGEA